jgi:hypothetical protein
VRPFTSFAYGRSGFDEGHIVKAVMFGGAAAIIGGGLYVHNPYVGGTVYQMPVAAVYEKLAEMDLPSDMGGGSYRSGGGVEMDREENKSVTWKIRQDGDIIARYTAELSPMGTKATTVRVKFEIDPEGKVAKQNSKIAQSKFVADMANITMSEQVDATLTNREYNQRAVGAKMLAYIMLNRDALSGFMADIESEMDSARSMAGVSSSRSGVAEARVDDGGTGPQMSARPTVDVTKYSR